MRHTFWRLSKRCLREEGRLISSVGGPTLRDWDPGKMQGDKGRCQLSASIPNPPRCEQAALDFHIFSAVMDCAFKPWIQTNPPFLHCSSLCMELIMYPYNHKQHTN